MSTNSTFLKKLMMEGSILRLLLAVKNSVRNLRLFEKCVVFAGYWNLQWIAAPSNLEIKWCWWIGKIPRRHLYSVSLFFDCDNFSNELRIELPCEVWKLPNFWNPLDSFHWEISFSLPIFFIVLGIQLATAVKFRLCMPKCNFNWCVIPGMTSRGV